MELCWLWMVWGFQCSCLAVLPKVFDCGPPMRYFDGSTRWALQPLRWFLPSMPFLAWGTVESASNVWSDFCCSTREGLQFHGEDIVEWSDARSHCLDCWRGHFVGFLPCCWLAQGAGWHADWVPCEACATELRRRDSVTHSWLEPQGHAFVLFPKQLFSWGTKPCPSNSTSWPAHVHYSRWAGTVQAMLKLEMEPCDTLLAPASQEHS